MTTEITNQTTAANLAVAMQTAELYSKSDIVPKAFQGNAGNCFIALELAARLDASAFMVMQNMDVIHGKPGFSAKFLIGCFNSCGRFSPIGYRLKVTGEEKTVSLEVEKWEGSQGSRRKTTVKIPYTYTPTSCVAYATDLRSGAEVEGPPVSYDMALEEGWVAKDGSKWLTGMRELMLRYRAAAFMVRVTAPEISLGLPTSEEIHDTEGFEKSRNVTPRAELSDESNPFKRPAITEKQESEPISNLNQIAINLEADNIKVKEALGALLTLGVGDGKTPFSKMDDATLAHIVADWENVRNMVRQLAGGEA